MKKLLTLGIICIIASILFSSCRSNLFIIKRHYTNGYYIAHSNGKQTATSVKEDRIAPDRPKKTLHSINEQAEKT
ncbi:MAG TPA: hypothetical protein VNY73_04665, partial [Bacteroidia bacterium]|nr:hypothetical protein [Bacteroidia bacterium]